MANSTKIHWVRTILAGILAELAVFLIVFPVLHFWGQRAFLASILIASALVPFLFAIWLCRHVESRFVLHGALVGLVAALFYTGLALGLGQTQPFLFKIAHVLKVVGGACGGVVAAQGVRQVRDNL